MTNFMFYIYLGGIDRALTMRWIAVVSNGFLRNWSTFKHRGNTTLRMSNFDHRPWIQAATADPVWADQLSSLPREYHTPHVKL